MKGLLAGLGGLGKTRLAALAGVGAATLGLVLLLALHMGDNAPMSLLYNDLDLRDASAMADLLDKAHIPHQSSPDGGTLMVPRNLVAQARLALARSGLPNGGSIGYEIFDRGDDLTATQFQQTINETRALEGELARSIELMRGVRGVRVHLVLPRHEPFAQEQQEAQASVLLTMAGGARMDHEGVQAILSLVAAAVPGLKPRAIAIVDDRGEVLARAGQAIDGADGGETADELRQATQLRLAHEVEAMLTPSLGDGHVRAEASVDMDFAQTHETDEKYDPDGQVARSTQTITDAAKSTDKATTVSVQNNLPNPDPGSGASGSQDDRHEETTNYEIGKTVTEVIRDQPRIRRITLAVLVDGVTVKGVWHERPAEELARIATLARGVIGYSAARGDKVDVVSMRFADSPVAAAAAGRFALGLDGADWARVAQAGIFGAIALIAVMVVLRPAALRLTQIAAPVAEATPELLAAPVTAGLLTDESMINLANVEGQIRASAIRGIAELVERHPEASVSIVRNWIAQDAPA